MKKILFFLIIIGLIGGGYYYWQHKKPKPDATPTVVVTKGTIVDKAQAIGYIKPRQSSTVKSAVGGSVAQIFHRAGDYVKKGTSLLEVKPEPEPAVYATAYQTLQENIAVERQAKKDLDRYGPALQSKLITKNYSAYIDARKNYDSAHEQRILAAQKLALLDKGTTKVGNKQIANVVVSPVTGYILTRNVDVGDPVISLSSAQSSTSLFTMANMNDLMFEGSVDEMDAAKIHLKMPAEITIGANAKTKISGIVTKIALQSEQESAKTGSSQPDANLPFNVSFEVQVTELKIPTKLTLRSGYSATADIKLKTAKNILLLPERVLHFKNDKVYVLLPAPADVTPKEKIVTIGLSDGMNAEILTGLKAGDKVLDKPDVVGD